MAYLTKRLGLLLITLLAASALIFVALDWLPGNAAQLALGPEATPEAVAERERQLGLDRPTWVRYGGWLQGLAHGDMGLSSAYDGTPVTELLLERLAVTLPLSLLAMALTVVLALAAGWWAASQHGRWGDQLVMGLTQLGLAVPSFWLGMLLVLLFAVKWQLLAAGGFPGWREDVGGGLWPGLQALLLPAVSLALVQAAILARIARSALLDVAREDFMRTARAKGLSRRAALWRHGLRHAAIPLLTLGGLQFTNLLAGAIVIENVFTLPGLGQLLAKAIANRDLVVVRNGVMLLTALVLLINFAVDLLHGWIDPRVRTRSAA
ncbi:peptide/nickel transport system permease protein [Roseateles sp. YR242]|uniref:ABC transporter permease n=1 Tax=Roseateles sp. YR242 TaxID=1855305 RepID=UPI0008B865E7|nr:ABC transporter permease [Roseateles sp. YR242]SEK80737.1 peptide/nickel transport system permease protein [Roseateles sp. YR242]